jgi:hypothetical protein
MKYDRARNLGVQAFDDCARFGRAGIARRGQHDRDGMPRVEAQIALAEPSLPYGLGDFHERSIDQRKKHLRFRITSADVKLEDARAALGPDQTDKEDPPEIDTFRPEGGQNGLHDQLRDFRLQLHRRKRGGCIRAHAARVRTRLAVPELFVVLRDRQHDVRQPVA